jgi:hypothetical protein
VGAGVGPYDGIAGIARSIQVKILMRRSTVLHLALVLLLWMPILIPAQVPGNPINWCRNGLFPEDSKDFKIATITGPKNERINFFSDENDCPKSDPMKCKKKSYLIPGDQVIVSRKFENWACCWYQPKKGSETVGWIPIESLTISDSDSNPPLNKWVGNWKYYEQSLNIKIDGNTGFLTVTGEAYWRGLGDNIHTGAIEARAKPNRNELKLEEEVCQLSLKLVGDYIIAVDNTDCGGANVRFNGVYRKR